MKKENILNILVLFFSLILICILPYTAAEGEETYWAITYDFDGGFDTATSIEQTMDGGYVLAGGYGYGITKVAPNGDVEWHQIYHRNFNDQANGIKQTQDGGYIVSGTSSLNLDDKKWVIKLDSGGNSQWQKIASLQDSSYRSRAYSVKEVLAQDGSSEGYVIVGSTIHLTGDSWDVWVLKIDSIGEISWQKTYNIQTDGAYAVDQTFDQEGVPTGYIVAGSTDYFGGNAWLLKIDLNGIVEWDKIYGGSSRNANSIRQTRDGGFIVAGPGVDENLSPGRHFWLAKLSSEGSVQWQKIFGGLNSEDVVFSVEEVFDISGDPTGYVVAGETSNFGAGQKDIWVLKFSLDGSIEWQKTYGSDLDESASSIKQSYDPNGIPDGYVLAGYTWPFSNTKVAFVLKLNNNGEIPECNLMNNSDASVLDGTWFFYPDPPEVVVTKSSSSLLDTDVLSSNSDILTERICFSEPNLVFEIEIDIKSGVDPYCFESDGHGFIPVTIYGGLNFDVSEINPASVNLDGQSVRIAGGKAKLFIKDADKDGINDLVLQIENIVGTYKPEDTIATLKGETIEGVVFEGTDTICILP